MRVIVGGQVVAESEKIVRLGTEYYFPAESVRMELLVATGHVRHCHWKGSGVCSSVVVEGVVFPDAAWVLPHPFWEAMEVKGMYAFDPTQVRIEE